MEPTIAEIAGYLILLACTTAWLFFNLNPATGPSASNDWRAPDSCIEDLDAWNRNYDRIQRRR